MRLLSPPTLAAALLLAGCAPVVRHGPPATLPIVHPGVDADRWYVVVDLGELGEHLFFLDTGYSRTTCDDAFADQLGAQPGRRVRVHGEAGSIDSRVARLPSARLNGHTIERWTCLVRDLHQTSSIRDPAEVPVAGVLGSDVLRRFLVTVDPTTSTLRLEAPSDGPAFALSAPGAVRLRREGGFGTRPVLRVDVGGRPARAILDTGASGTWVDGERLGLVPDEVVSGAVLRGSGSGGSVTRDLTWYEVDVGVAGHAHTVRALQRDAGPGQPGLLGLDVLGDLHQTWDFAHRRARFEPVQPVDVPSWRRYQATRDDERRD